MPKKEKKDFQDMLLEKSPGIILKTLKGFIEDVSESVIQKIHKSEKKFMATFISFIQLAAGTIFLAIALIFLINEYLGLSKGWSFLVIGLVLIIWSIILKNHYEKI